MVSSDIKENSVISSEERSKIAASIQSALSGSTYVIEGVFLVLKWDPKKPAIMVGNHPNAPAGQRTLPQFDIGVVRWGGLDAFVRSAEEAFRAHIKIAGPNPVFELIDVHGHDGLSTKKLLIYFGVIVSAKTSVELVSRESFDNEEWVNPSNSSFQDSIMKGVRNTAKARKHLEIVGKLVGFAPQIKQKRNLAA
jgi:hypothetical protein